MSRCGACVLEAPPQTHTVAALDYRYPWDGLIHRFKYRSAPELAGPLAERLFAPVAHAMSQGMARPDWVLPVPLSPGRLRERGYNQAWELARQLGRATGVPARADALLRLPEAGHQQGQSRQQRLQLVRGAFAVAPQAVAALRGCRVALVDDVYTTGATAQALAATVLRAGAAEVQVWVLARTPH